MAIAGAVLAAIPIVSYMRSCRAARAEAGSANFRSSRSTSGFAIKTSRAIGAYLEQTQADVIVIAGARVATRRAALGRFLPSYPHVYNAAAAARRGHLHALADRVGANRCALAEGRARRRARQSIGDGTPVTVLGAHLHWPIGLAQFAAAQ